MTQESLARKLRVLRAERGITLAEAEELTGVTRETLGALEHGQRGAYTSTLQKIAEGYGTTVGALLEEPEFSHAGKAEAPETGRAGADEETLVRFYYDDPEQQDEAFGKALAYLNDFHAEYKDYLPVGYALVIRDDGGAVLVTLRDGPSAKPEREEILDPIFEPTREESAVVEPVEEAAVVESVEESVEESVDAETPRVGKRRRRV